jgi:NTE family protein
MRALAFLCAFALIGCATATPINVPLAGPQIEAPGRAPAGEDLIILTLSGGGARAASFALGVLQGLRDMAGDDGRPLTEHVALISSVSGGSVLAAYYGLHGESGLDTFRAAYLDKDWPIRRSTSPLGWFGAARGGVNGPAQLADWLDREVYFGARMEALTAGPRVALNASDLYNGTPFAFTPLFFDGVCSDLAQVRIADAVAASMAVPVMFKPVLAESFPGPDCPPLDWPDRLASERTTPESVRAAAHAFRNYRGDPRAGQRYVHLSDGGVTDYFGLSSLFITHAAGPPPAPLAPREAVQARRVLVMVVNAEHVRPRTYQQRGTDAIGAYEMLYAPLDAAASAAMRASADAFRSNLPDFERDLRQFRCGLDPRHVRELGADRPGWMCEDVSVTMDVISFHDMSPDAYDALYDTRTDVSLEPETVTALIAAGRAAAEANAALRAFAASP